MRWKIQLNTENIFLLSGIGIIVLGWASDYIGISLGEVGTGHGAGSIISRLFFPMIGLLFAAGGAVYENHWRFLTDSKFAKRYLLQALFILDGALHLYAMNDHLSESLVEVLFFAILGPVQIAFGILITRLPAKYDPYILVWPVFLVGIAVVSQFVVIWPLSGVENIYDLWVVSKLVEVLTVLVLVSLMREDRTLNWATFKRAALAVAGR